jgi:endonuclease/exonuclease/phosphatase family metal-dependent hydrolase
LLAVIALLISYAAIYIPPDTFWIPALFGLAYPFLLGSNLFFVVLWLFLKSKNFLFSFICILIGWSFIGTYFQAKAKTNAGAGIKILSYNVGHFLGNDSKSVDKNSKAIVSFLIEENADIICLQETRIGWKNVFKLSEVVKKIESIKHYQYARSSNSYGMVTLTHYPIVNMKEVRFENSRNMAIYTDVLIDSDTVRIFNVHMQSYRIDPKKYSIIESPGFTEEEDIEEVKEMGAKFKQGFKLRAKQARDIRKIIDKTPYPVILCGDFNDTPTSFAYKQLSEKLNDAFVQSGKGFGQTYVGKLPSFRIDYILHGNDFDSYNFETLDFEYSDHLPVTCDLVKK